MYTGVGSNGKSVWLDWLRDFFGRENAAQVSLHDLASNRFRVAELDGKLINIYADLKSNALKENDIIKPLISGDAITVEKKMQHPFSMKPYTKLFFSANRIPEINDESIGMYRRLSLTRWDIVFTEIDRDVNKFKKIDTDRERSGMFNIFLRTLKKLIKRGRFLNENSMEDRRDTWKVTADPVIEYVERYITKIGGEGGISYDELYNHFTSVTDNEQVILKPTFQRKIMALTGAMRSSVRENGVQKSSFKGITLRSKLKDEGQASLDNSGDTTPKDSGSAFVTMN
jgi:putative DNA primase/helicase